MSTETVRIERSHQSGRWTQYILSRPRSGRLDKVDHYSIEIDRRDGVLHVEARRVTTSGRKTTTSPSLSPAELAVDVRSALMAAMSPEHSALTLAAAAAYAPRRDPEPLPAACMPAEQERTIAANHAADVANGMSEADANESDAFERRVMGLDYGD